MTPPRAWFRAVWFIHQTLRRVSGGRLGTRAARSDRIGTLFIHTVGRKSGEPRVNGLFYLADGSHLVAVASNAGAENDPAWWLNPTGRSRSSSWNLARGSEGAIRPPAPVDRHGRTVGMAHSPDPPHDGL